MKIAEMAISAILKKGLLYEAKDMDINVDIPVTVEGKEQNMKVNVKCEYMTLRIEKTESLLGLFLFTRNLHGI